MIFFDKCYSLASLNSHIVKDIIVQTIAKLYDVNYFMKFFRIILKTCSKVPNSVVIFIRTAVLVISFQFFQQLGGAMLTKKSVIFEFHVVIHVGDKVNCFFICKCVILVLLIVFVYQLKSGFGKYVPGLRFLYKRTFYSITL